MEFVFKSFPWLLLTFWFKKNYYLWLILTNLVITIQKYILICCLIQLFFLLVGGGILFFYIFFRENFFLFLSLFGFYLLFSFSFIYLICLYLLHFSMSGFFFHFSLFIQHFFVCSCLICFYSFSISFRLLFTFSFVTPIFIISKNIFPWLLLTQSHTNLLISIFSYYSWVSHCYFLWLLSTRGLFQLVKLRPFCRHVKIYFY